MSSCVDIISTCDETGSVVVAFRAPIHLNTERRLINMSFDWNNEIYFFGDKDRRRMNWPPFVVVRKIFIGGIRPKQVSSKTFSSESNTSLHQLIRSGERPMMFIKHSSNTDQSEISSSIRKGIQHTKKAMNVTPT